MKYVYVIFGFISLGLGCLGIVIPILPTTPFLLVTSYCFMKGSDRFHKWFISTTLYKKYLDDFVQTRSMTKRNKIIILSFVSALLLIAFVSINQIHARICILVVMTVKYYYFLFRIKTIGVEDINDDQQTSN